MDLKGAVLAYVKADDQRPSTKTIDKIYGSDPIEEEIKSTVLFQKVLLIPEDKINDEEYLQNRRHDAFETLHPAGRPR